MAAGPEYPTGQRSRHSSPSKGKPVSYTHLVKEAPPADVPVLIREVRRVGNTLNQIMKRANALGLMDVPQLRKALDENRVVEKLIVDAYTTSSD